MKPKTFEEVRSFLSSIPFINSGGCGISALAMYLWLLENEKKVVNIVFCYKSSYSFDYRQNKRMIKNRFSPLIVPQHVAISYKHKRYDSDGRIFAGRYKYAHRVTITQLIDTINEINDWNDAFDRDYVRRIERYLNIKLPIEK